MRKKTATILCLLIYKISYEIIYAYVSSRIFSYSGLTWNPVVWKCVLSYAIFFGIALLPERNNTVTKYLMNVYFIFTIIPMLSLFWQSDRSTAYIIMCSICYLIMHIGCYITNENRANKIVIGDVFHAINQAQILIVIVSNV